jgi:hypothetical protein
MRLSIVVVTGCLTVAAGEGQCDRACLNGFVDRYLAAMVAHDPTGLPLAKAVKYTENGQTLKLGEGMWGVANAVGKYKLYFADPASGGAGFFGVVEENGHPQILALRLRIEERRISEIEAIVARTTPGAWAKPEALTEKPIFSESLAPAERRFPIEAVLLPAPYGMPSGWGGDGGAGQCDRGCLEGFIDQYLDAVVAHDLSRLLIAKAVKFTENGQRLELGDGLWGTARARGAYKPYVADPEARGAHGERGARNLEKMGGPLGRGGAGMQSAVRIRLLPLRDADPGPAIRGRGPGAGPGARVRVLRSRGQLPAGETAGWASAPGRAGASLHLGDCGAVQDRAGEDPAD